MGKHKAKRAKGKATRAQRRAAAAAVKAAAKSRAAVQAWAAATLAGPPLSEREVRRPAGVFVSAVLLLAPRRRRAPRWLTATAHLTLTLR